MRNSVKMNETCAILIIEEIQLRTLQYVILHSVHSVS